MTDVDASLNFKSLCDEDAIFARFYKEYKALLTSMSDGVTCLSMLEGQIDSLGRQAEHYTAARQSLVDDNLRFEGVDKLHPRLRRKLLDNLTGLASVNAMARTQMINSKRSNPSQIFSELIDSAKATLAFIENPEQHTEGNAATIKNTFTESDIVKRFFPIDLMFEKLTAPFLKKPEGKTPNIEAIYQAQFFVPESVNIAKYRFILAWMNAKYDLGLDENEISFRGSMLASLAKHPRGLTNPAIGDEFKLMHNASIHSFKSIIMLCEALNEISNSAITSSGNPGGMPAEAVNILITRINKLKKGLVLGLTDHDLPEERWAEISVGYDTASTPVNERAEFKRQRDIVEAYTLSQTLEHFSKAADRGGMAASDIERIVKQVQDACHLVESGGKFWGLALNVIEKIQSNFDYITMSSFGSSRPLSETIERDKDFSINYVIKKLFGCTIPDTPSNLQPEFRDDIEPEEIARIRAEAKERRDEEIKKLAPHPEKSLQAVMLKPEGNPSNVVEAKLQSLLYQEILKSFSFVWEKYCASYGVSDEARNSALTNLTKGRELT